MSFNSPWLLWALFAASVPIIIHLVNRWRHRSVPWAAMEFLLRAARETRGTKKLLHYLILALRVMAIFCSLGLITENRLWPMVAASLAPTGCLMAFLALWTGSLWGRPTWGAYWVWDARLTSALILFFFYLGYIALQNANPDWRRADKACAVIGIVGVINVPIVYFSVQWWNTLHQGASITASGSSIHPVMLWALALMVIGFWLYTFAVTFVRLRSVILERERNQEWAQQLALKGEL